MKSIKIKEEDQKQVKALSDKEQMARVAFFESARMLKDSSEDLWGYINKHYPECAVRKCSLYRPTLEILILD